jgi:hypothetical protein
MKSKCPPPFDPKALLAKLSDGRSVKAFRRKEVVFSQGDAADEVLYVEKGRVRLSVVSKQGKEAVLGFVVADMFFGEGCLAGQQVRMSTATATEEAIIHFIRKKAMMRRLHTDTKFSEQNEYSSLQPGQRNHQQFHAAPLDVPAEIAHAPGAQGVSHRWQRAADEQQELVEYVRENHIGLVGIGAMTRMIRKAYQMADAVRAAGVPVVMGGPHVTEVPDEPLGRGGEPRHADAVALGEADQTWPAIVADAERGELKEIYAPLNTGGKEVKPSLDDYPVIPWDRMDLDQFNLIKHFPKMARRLLSLFGMTWQSFHLIPIESGRGCPYGCEFCTVTGFFGDSIRFRSNESVVNELLMLKALEKRQKGKVAVFFIDDNFAINPRRTKSLLREIIARGAQVPWVAQISMNLLRDEELVSLISQSGGRWIFMGLESIDPENLKSVSKGFNKPGEYKAYSGTPGATQSLCHHLLHLRDG